METWILIFILIGVGVGVSHISNQLASLTNAVVRQTTDIAYHLDNPQSTPPTAKEIAEEIGFNLKFDSQLAEEIAKEITVSEIDERIGRAVGREVRLQLKDHFDHLEDILKGQMGYPQFQSPDPSRPDDLRDHLTTIEWKLENIKGV